MEAQSGGSAQPGSQTLPPVAALRVGILVDSLCLPRWARKLVEDIRASTFARVVLVARRAPGRPARFQPRYLLHDLYAAVDRLLFRAPSDAFATADARDLLRECAIVDLPDATPGPDDLARFRAHDLDVAIALAPGFRPDDYASVAKHGVWSLGEAASGEALPGFLEVLEAAPTTPARVEVRRRNAAPKVLRGSHGPTDHISVRRNRSVVGWKGAALLLRGLRDLHADGPQALAREADAGSAVARERPGNLAMAGLLARLSFRYVRSKLRHLVAREQWYCAYRLEEGAGPREGFDGLVEMMPPKDRFWADPFPVRTADGRTYVFFEELSYRDWKGRIMASEIVPGQGALPPRQVLERPYHLSYPQVFSWRGQYYMLPETSANRTVTLFRCVSFPDRWVEEQDLLRDVDAVDATLAEIGGCWWMFVNLGLPGAGNRDELHLYHAPSPLGPWTPHARNPVKSDCRSARPAGAPFLRDGRLWRPAQNCGGAYGASIVIHRVDELTPETFRETAVEEIAPTWDRRARRIHTLNRCDGLLVVDLLRRRSRFF